MIKQWLSRQAFWQVHLPAPKRVDRPHYQVTTPNEMHQFDLLYMPYLLGGPESAMVTAPWRAFVSEELLLILEDTELPPDYIQKW